MTVFLTPPAMFRGNQQAMAWAKGVADQGKAIQTWNPQLDTSGGGSVSSVTTTLAAYNFTGGTVMVSIEIDFTISVLAGAMSFLLPLPSSTWDLGAASINTLRIDTPAGATFWAAASVTTGGAGGICYFTLLDAALAYTTLGLGAYKVYGTFSYLSPGIKSGIVSS